MLIRFGLLSLLALTACSDDPQPAEPVADDAPAGEPQLVDEPAAPTEASAAAEAAASDEEPKAGTKNPPVKVWVSGASAQPAAKPVQAAAEPAPKASDTTFWVFVDGANVRATPSLSGKVVGKLAWGEKLTSLGVTNGFVKIGEGRFVHRKMLTDRKKRFGRGQAAH